MSTLEGIAASVGLALRSGNVPGCSVALVDRSGLRWSAGFGLADVATGREATADTVYHLFSGTKLFTATAVLRLTEQGLLELEDPLSRYVPEAGTGHVSLLHLLSHLSGLKDTLRGFLAVTLPTEEPCTTAEALARYRIEFALRPGERVQYRNINYALLGELVSRVVGVQYRDFVRSEILRPLGIRGGFTVTDGMRPRAATGYLERFDPMRMALRIILRDTMRHTMRRLEGQRAGGLVALGEYNLCSAAVGGLIGTVGDFGRFLHMQLTGGGGVLQPASVRRMQTLVARGRPGIESRVGMGLGWKLGQVGDRPFMNHEGGGAGFASELRIYPESRIGVALAMNGMRMPRTARVAHRICEAVFAARDELGA